MLGLRKTANYQMLGNNDWMVGSCYDNLGVIVAQKFIVLFA